MHPHHHGSGSIQTQLTSVPTFVDPNPGVGFDFFNTPSCQAVKPYFQADNEIIMHMQVNGTIFCAVAALEGGSNVYSGAHCHQGVAEQV